MQTRSAVLMSSGPVYLQIIPICYKYSNMAASATEHTPVPILGHKFYQMKADFQEDLTPLLLKP